MRDLSNELTIFIITTSGDVNYNDCIKALKNQTVKFKLDIIKDYYPLSKAFQEMLNRCKTKYYIEIDSDMILNPDAVERMYNSIIATDDKHPMVCYQLLDIHLDFKIYGVKIYDYKTFKNYPYNLKHPSTEIEQMNRMKKDGYIFNDEFAGMGLVPEVIGKHSPNWTNQTIFERYYNLMEKFKLYRYVWMEKLPNKLLKIFKNKPTQLNMYALLGAFSSIFSNETIEEEKDVRHKRKNFKRMESYFETPQQATIYMTSKCNFKCSFCYRQHNEIEQAPDMTTDIVDILLGKFPSIKGVCVCGFGEPLLSPNLVPILQTLKSANKVVGLITNGSLLVKRLNDLVGWFSPDYISVSLNAHCKEFHQKETKTDTWDIVLEGIKAVVGSKIPCYVSSVVTTENIKYVPELLKLVKSLGVKTVHLHNLLPHFDENKNEHFWKLVLTTKHQNLIDEIKKLPEADIVKKYPTLIDKSEGNQTCNFPWRSIQVDGNGSIGLCNSVLPVHSSHGNINDFVVWNNKYCQKFRDDFVDKKHEMCKKCFRNWDWGF